MPLEITRGFRQADAWNWEQEVYKETTKHCNTVYTGLVYLERRLDFVMGLSKFILDCIIYCDGRVLLQSSEVLKRETVSNELKEGVLNAHNLASGQIHQILCL